MLRHIALEVQIHFLVIVFALTLLFHIKLSQMTKEAIENEIENTVDGILNHTRLPFDSLDCSQKKLVAMIDNAISENVCDSSDVNNKWLYTANLVFVAMLTLCLALFSTRFRISSNKLQHTIFASMLSLFVVSIYEGLFVAKVATKYVPIKADVISRTAIDRAKSNVLPGQTLALTDISDKSSFKFMALGVLSVMVGAGFLSNTTPSVKQSKTLKTPKTPKTPNFKSPQLGNTTLSWVYNHIDNPILPIIGGVSIGLMVTVLYFTSARKAEEKQVKRQVERTVDVAFRRYRRLLNTLSYTDSKEVEGRITDAVLNLPYPDTTAAQREIDTHNAPLEKTAKVMFIVGFVSVGLLSALAIFSSKAKGEMNNTTRKIFATIALSASVSFCAEYGFLQFVVSNFEAVNEKRVLHRVLARLEEC